MNTVYAQGLSVTLNSTLNAELTAYPQEIVVFTCTIRGSGILNWFSDEYIGMESLPLQIIAVGNTTTVRSNSDPNTVATRISVTNENGVIGIVSELRITASVLHLMAAVSCDDGGMQSRQSIFFRLSSKSIIFTIMIHDPGHYTSLPPPPPPPQVICKFLVHILACSTRGRDTEQHPKC